MPDLFRSLLAASLCTFVLASGCSGTGTSGNGNGNGKGQGDASVAATADLATGPDLATPPDLAIAPDLAKRPGACTNDADVAVLMAKVNDIQGILSSCAQSSFGKEPAAHDCIKQMTGLSDACTTCFSNGLDCAIKNCFSPCLSDATSAACVTCRMKNCDPGFVSCSGLAAQ
jgi:hypothetical protein